MYVVNKVSDIFDKPGIIDNEFIMLINIKCESLIFFSLLEFLLIISIIIAFNMMIMGVIFVMKNLVLKTGNNLLDIINIMIGIIVVIEK